MRFDGNEKWTSCTWYDNVENGPACVLHPVEYEVIKLYLVSIICRIAFNNLIDFSYLFLSSISEILSAGNKNRMYLYRIHKKHQTICDLHTSCVTHTLCDTHLLCETYTFSPKHIYLGNWK